jgi:hypothetical protein
MISFAITTTWEKWTWEITMVSGGILGLSMLILEIYKKSKLYGISNKLIDK